MRTAANFSHNAGFTLVEALVSTLLMSLIFAALAIITAQWLPNWDRGFARLQRGGVLAASLERLTSDLAAAEYVSAGGIKDPPLFDGGEIAVTFVRTTLAPNKFAGLELVRLTEVGDEHGPALVRSTAPLPIGATGPSTDGAAVFANPVVMVRAPYRASFSYAGPDRVWKETWRGMDELPRAVRISLRDSATSMLLDVSTSTLIHAELPARCTWAKTVADCPMLKSNVSSANSAGAKGAGG